MLEGTLSYHTVTYQFWETSKALLMSEPAPIHIDLKNVAQSDSTGVALLIAWRRWAQQQKKEISFLHVSDQMRAIMRVSGLEKLL